MRVVRHATARAFVDRARPVLLAAEVEHNLVLGIAAGFAGRGPVPDDVLLATVERGGTVQGVCFRTPPFNLAVFPMPTAVCPALAAFVRGVYDELPGVMGPLEVAAVFAAAWSAQEGVTSRERMRQRIHKLETVTEPGPRPPGTMRNATRDDLPLLTAWLEAFEREAHVPITRGRGFDTKVEAGDVVLWEHEGPAAMAAVAGRTPHGARIGPVYTPPERRRRGYAGALTADLSRRVLAGGAQFCCLYTDLANPTSNAIYARIGYAPVCDVVEYAFAP